MAIDPRASQTAVPQRGAELIEGPDCGNGDALGGQDDARPERRVNNVCMGPSCAVRLARMHFERVTATPGPRHRYLTKESYHSSYVKNVLVKYRKCDCGQIPTTQNLASPFCLF